MMSQSQLEAMQLTDNRVVGFSRRDTPACLRSVSHFTVEAQRAILRFVAGAPTPSIAKSGRKIAMTCLDHAIRLINYMGTTIDTAGEVFLEECLAVRDVLAQGLGVPPSQCAQLKRGEDRERNAAETFLFFEAAELLDLATTQYQEGMRRDAYNTFHLASIFYRVLESMIPSMNAEIQERLAYAVSCARQCSYLQENFVQEHFSGDACSQYYDVHGRKKLGKGSYGSVYLATHRGTSDDRAVKVMNVDRVTSYYLRKLHTEISILKEVDHPNIIKLHEVFFGRRSVYLVTDLCRGGELFELLSSGKNQGFVFREDRAASLLRDMLRAVKYLHFKGIVHRDLKLENFLFEGDSSSSPLVLIDFGLSKHFDPHERMRQRVGSCYYTAPEVLAGDYDYRCDLWSLGVICYMLLSGTPPFGGKTPDDIHNSTLTKPLVFPERAFRHVSKVSIDFLSRLLVKDPTLRMTTEEALQHPFIALAGLSSLPPPVPARPSDSAVASTIPPPPSISAAPAAAGLLNVRGKPFSSEHANKLLSCCFAFAESSSITRLLLCMVSFSMSWEKTLEFRNEFFALDTNGSGTLSFEEFSRITDCLPYVVDDKKLRAVFNALTLTDVETMALANRRRSDDDLKLLAGSTAQVAGTKLKDELQYREFIAAALYHRLPVEQERFLLLFDHLDCDNEGVITSVSLQQMLGRDLTVHDIEMCIMSSVRLLDSGVGARCPGSTGVTSLMLRKTDFEAIWLRYLESRPQDLSLIFSGKSASQDRPIVDDDKMHIDTDGTDVMVLTMDDDSCTLMRPDSSAAEQGVSGSPKNFFGRPSSLKAAASSVFSCLR